MVMFVLWKGGSVNVTSLRLTDYLPGCGYKYRYGHELTFAKHFMVYKALSHILYNSI